MRRAISCKRAYDLQSQGDYAKAIAAFKDEIDRFPSIKGMAESAHVCIVECLHGLGKTDEATVYAKKLYDEQPEMRAGALFAQGLLSMYAKHYDASAALFGG